MAHTSRVTHRRVDVQPQEDQTIVTSQQQQQQLQPSNHRRIPSALPLVVVLLLSLLLTPSLAVGASSSSSSSSVGHLSLHHLSLYSSPTSPPTTLSFLLGWVQVETDGPTAAGPGEAELQFQVGKDEVGADGVAFQLVSLSQLRVDQLGADFAEVACDSGAAATGDVSDATIKLHPFPLSHTVDKNASAPGEHVSTFDHWLISSDALAHKTASDRTKHVRSHTPLSFILPQVAGHRETELAQYIRTLPLVRRQLRAHPRTTLLFAAPVEAHLPWYDRVTMWNVTELVPPPPSTPTAATSSSSPPQKARWQCQFRFKPRQEQRAYPFTSVFVQRRPSKSAASRSSSNIRGGGRGSRVVRRLLPTAPISLRATWGLPRHGVLISPPISSARRVIQQALNPSLAEQAAFERETAQRKELSRERREQEERQAEGVVSLLDLDAVLGIQGAAVKAVLDPVLKILGEAIADEGEHTTDEEAGSRIDESTPSQVMELTLDPLKDALKDGVGNGVTDTVMASLTGSMTEYLGEYIHDEVVHDATPPLYQAVTEILEKHVKDQILAIVPAAIRRHVPVVLTNRLGRALMHSIPPAVTQILKIAHSPALQYFCHRCFYHDQKEYSLFKPTLEKSGYEKVRSDRGVDLPLD